MGPVPKKALEYKPGIVIQQVSDKQTPDINISHPSLVADYNQRMEENECHKIDRSRAQERKTPEGTLKKKEKSVRIPATSRSFQDKGSLFSQEDLCPASQLWMWTEFYNKSDPRIALGKYSPLEKEILRLGGLHTAATRRFLAYKQEEERKMLKQLQQLSSDYKRAMEYKKQNPFPRPTCRPFEKIWTANVTVSPEEFKMPQRERANIRKHVQRMRFAEASRNTHLLPRSGRLRNASCLSGVGAGPKAKNKAREEEDDCDADNQLPTKQEETKETESKSTNREIELNITFKSEEPKKRLTCNANGRKPFLPTAKLERCITGPTNRCLFHCSDFPGDLMLMNQNFKSRGIRPGM